LSERVASTVPEPIAPPQGYERLEGLSELIRRITSHKPRPGPMSFAPEAGRTRRDERRHHR